MIAKVYFERNRQIRPTVRKNNVISGCQFDYKLAKDRLHKARMGNNAGTNTENKSNEKGKVGCIAESNVERTNRMSKVKWAIMQELMQKELNE